MSDKTIDELDEVVGDPYGCMVYVSQFASQDKKFNLQNFIPEIKRKMLTLGFWNMDATSTLIIPYPDGITKDNIINISAKIRLDPSAGSGILYHSMFTEMKIGETDVPGNIGLFNDGIWLTRNSAGRYNDPDFSDSNTNRGFLVIDYLE